MPNTAYAVVEYYRDQSYGGPEEGGWWYDTYEAVEDWATNIQWFLNEDVAHEVARVFNEEAREQHSYIRCLVWQVPRREVRSEYETCHDDVPYEDDDDTFYETRTDIPLNLPEHRPHYC